MSGIKEFPLNNVTEIYEREIPLTKEDRLIGPILN